MNQMIENVAMKLTHIHVVIHLSSFTISHQSSLSPLCLPVRNISLREAQFGYVIHNSHRCTDVVDGPYRNFF